MILHLSARSFSDLVVSERCSPIVMYRYDSNSTKLAVFQLCQSTLAMPAWTVKQTISGAWPRTF